MLRLQARSTPARRGALAAATAVAALLATTAHAEPSAGATTHLRSADVVEPMLGADAIGPRWAALRMADDGSEAERSAWEQLRAVRLESGVRNLPHHAVALVVDAADALGRGDRRRALELLAWADEIDPDGSEARFVEARAQHQIDPLGLPTVLKFAADGWHRRLSTAQGRQAMKTGIAALGALAAVVLAAVVVLAVAARRLGQLAFDVRLLLLRGPSLAQAHVLVALALAALAMSTASPMLLLGALIAVAAPYAGWQERCALLVATAAVAAFPVLVHEGFRSMAADAERVDRIALAPLSICDATCVAMLRERAAAGDADAELALAWVLFRAGDDASMAEATSLLSSARQRGAQSAAAACLAGSLAYVAGETSTAERHWREVLGATTSRDTQAAAAINLARSLRQAGDQLGATQSFERAEQLSPRLAAQYRTYAGRSQNRVLAACALDVATGWEAARASVDEARIRLLAQPVVAAWQGRSVPGPADWLPAGLAVWIVLSTVFGWMGLVNCRCKQCGTPTSRLVYRRAWLDRSCIACYQLAVVGPQLSFAQRHARERRIDVRASRLRLWTALAGLAIPGGGLLGRGQAVAGILLAIPACLSAVLLVARSALPSATDWILPELGIDGVRTCAIAVLGACWALSVLTEIVVLRRSR